MKRSTKKIILIIVDFLMIFCTLSTSLQFLEVIAEITPKYFLFSLIIISLVYFATGFYLKIYSILTRYTDYRAIANICIALLSSHFALLILSFLFFKAFSLRFIFLSLIFSLILVTTPRLVWRIIHTKKERIGEKNKRPLRTLVVGAGSGGSLFISTVLQNSNDIDIVGIIDGDPNKLNTYVHGKKVLGNRNDIARIAGELDIDQVTIAIPSLSGSEREKIVDICNELGIVVNTMPSVEEIIMGNVSVGALKEIDVSDLLGRKEVMLDQTKLGNYFDDKTILVTGAGGSIGSEICRQVLKFHPKRLLLLGHGENSIYQINREVSAKYSKYTEIKPLIADIQDRQLMFHLMQEYKPDIVYHAAAHKHVPMMEYNPREAVKNNIFGTKNVAEAAKAARVSKFVMISTDKAVNPPNVMGATKRVAEMIVTGLNDNKGTQFAAVRFGNVLGSRGSVVPLFKEQIKKGGPVTVTDFRMTRYFMTIPEASRLVIQAGYLAKGGEIFVLDMGEPVQILELAKKVIKLSGYNEGEIEIVESGIRPGEKLYEELLSKDERVSEQIYEKIFVGKVTNKEMSVVSQFIDELLIKNDKDLKESLVAFAKQE
ncbi:polysaccharide biosynthesis protein [Streptococcus sp. CSL10205-OR2]|uniref:polysaccharide biosynthesis protein n=1 Tax=Streptococcus sp. CSL10205-OR2 TaxID=2980558 RepID=UPI0021DA63E6|nr:nucleoside-diphosphate sugar epimerase/dehydratase [Streptococcus sp. CSL10205-OR2]MCU9533604.1 polysaccharide biosynthesis protein [Streptococcus sp. CSL10205-OR2]